MSVQESKKFLRIGIFRGKQRLEENVVKKRRTISVGTEDSNTFTVLSSAVPKKWNLFVHDADTDSYSLCISKSMRGRVVLDKDQTIVLDETLKPSDHVKFSGENIHIDLPNTARGRVIIGKINILFNFVSGQDKLVAARMSIQGANGTGVLGKFMSRSVAIALGLSILLHVIPLAYVGLQDWPRDDEFFFIPTLPKPVIIEEMKVVEEDEPEPEPEIVENSDNVLPEVPSVDVEPSPDPGTVSKSELMDQITDKHREAGARITAQILGVEGGVEGFYADMLGSNAHIADMSDIAAGDIGASASGNLLNQLAAANGTGGAGLLGIDSGKGNSGPKVVVEDKKKDAGRAKVDFNMKANDSEFVGAPPAGSKEGIESVFNKKKNDISNCYKTVINAQGKTTGRFVIAISISKDGTVFRVEKIEDQIGGEMFTCVKKRIMNWKFGALKAPVSFKKTWIFN